MQLVEEFYKRRDQSLLSHFCDTYKSYDELMSSQLEQKKKDNFNKLVEMLTRRMVNESRPHRAYRYFRIDRTREGDQLLYDLTFRPYVHRQLISGD